MGFAPYQVATRCTRGPQPGAVAFMKWADDFDPQAGNDGIFNCRNVRGGSVYSSHAEGRADDVHYDLVDGKPNPAGFAMVQLLRPHAADLGIGVMIWDHRIWSAKSPGRDGRPYSGPDAHTTHIHVEFTRAAAAKLTVATIKHVMAGLAVPKPAPAPKAGSRVLRLGMRGRDVLYVQKVIGGCAADGVYGPKTAARVRHYQEHKHLTADGVVAARTWAALARSAKRQAA